MFEFFRTLFIIVLMVPLSAWAEGGSRVGNGNNARTYQVDGVSVKYPNRYREKSSIEKDGMRLEGLPDSSISIGLSGMSRIAKPPTIDLLPLEQRLPQVKNLNGKELSGWFENKAWMEIKSTKPCLKAYSGDTADVTTTVVTNDTGDGVYIVAEKSEQSKKAVQEMIQNAEIGSEKCSWK